jgi:hypothetical protein
VNSRPVAPRFPENEPLSFLNLIHRRMTLALATLTLGLFLFVLFFGLVEASDRL